ncbi:nuclease-related domain-containing protein [Shewanella waksmanii]|uniref:nuclease-related domain-containing protein n=1 Tax=Shewanella waksmanii TaxID=213783 RepID=UPI0037361760
MILKTKSRKSQQAHAADTPQAKAGLKQEQDVAFFLRRAYKDHDEVMVINDLKFRFNDEVAQIDHLIVYTYGFVLIESKSIKGHVKVNQQGEWTRSLGAYQGKPKWQGMASPLKQVELQQALLLELLMHHRSEILGKLLGIKQQGFKGRCWHHLCAVSSDSVIDRKTMPKQVSDKLIKTEFLTDKLDEIMNLKSKFSRFISTTDTRPDFRPAELESVCNFMMEQDIASTDESASTNSTTAKYPTTPSDPQQIQVPTAIYQDEQLSATSTSISSTEKAPRLSCKHCGESTNYTPMYGKYGYYIHCNQCTKNTPMKQPCPQCQSKQTKVQKRKETYTLNCLECGNINQVI